MDPNIEGGVKDRSTFIFLNRNRDFFTIIVFTVAQIVVIAHACWEVAGSNPEGFNFCCQQMLDEYSETAR